MSGPRSLEEWFERKIVELTIQGKCQKVLSMVDEVSLNNMYFQSGNHLLHIAAQYNNIELLKKLPDRVGCKLTVKNRQGHIPLVTAIIYGNYGAAIYLYNMLVIEYSSRGYSQEEVESVLVEKLLYKLYKAQLNPAKIGVVIAKISNCHLRDVVRGYSNPITTEYFFETVTAMGKPVDFNGVAETAINKHDWPNLKLIINLASTRMTLFRSLWSFIIFRICDIHKSKSGKIFLKNIFSSQIFSKKTIEPLEIKLMNISMNKLKVFLQYDFPSVVKVQDGRYILAGIFGNPFIKVKALLNAEQIDVNGHGFGGKTPLHFAAEKGLKDNIKLLLDLGANPNALDANGRTPLTLAMQNSHFHKYLKMLLFAGANPLLISGKADLTEEYFYFESFMYANSYIIAQILIYEALGQSIKKSDNLFGSWSDNNFDNFIATCRCQLKELKIHRILDTQMTMFTVLSENPQKVARFASQEDVQAILSFVECNEKWLIPYYSELLKKRANDIVWMQCYRERAINIVCQIVGIFDTHHLVVNKIVDYFDDNDLRKFSAAKSSASENLSFMSKGMRLLKITKGFIPFKI